LKTLFFLSAIALTGLVLVVVMMLRPVPIPAEKECIIQEGVVISIDEGGVKDVIFTLKSRSCDSMLTEGLKEV
jgi:hypothetical protein